jgi:hypothetical protein
MSYRSENVGEKVDRWLSYVDWVVLTYWLVGAILIAAVTGGVTWWRTLAILVGSILLKAASVR